MLKVPNPFAVSKHLVLLRHSIFIHQAERLVFKGFVSVTYIGAIVCALGLTGDELQISSVGILKNVVCSFIVLQVSKHTEPLFRSRQFSSFLGSGGKFVSVWY